MMGEVSEIELRRAFTAFVHGAPRALCKHCKHYKLASRERGLSRFRSVRQAEPVECGRNPTDRPGPTKGLSLDESPRKKPARYSTGIPAPSGIPLYQAGIPIFGILIPARYSVSITEYRLGILEPARYSAGIVSAG